jgi:GDPmannose 4,6-dehydratase
MRPSEVPYLKGNYSKAKIVLGWDPKVGFEELVSRMVSYDIQQFKEQEIVG